MLWHRGNFSVKVVSKILVEEHAENVTEVVCWNILKFKYTSLIHTNTHHLYTQIHTQLTYVFQDRRGTNLNKKIKKRFL